MAADGQSGRTGCGGALALLEQADDKADNCHDSEYEEEYFGNFNRACRNAPKAKHGRHQSYHQKNNRIMQHLNLLAFAQSQRISFHETHR
jgi:hypothetical protein